MPFDIDPTYAIYGFAVLSAILFGEGVYLLFFSAASYRNRITHRLSLINDTVDRQSILVELRRERGLTTTGDFRLPAYALYLSSDHLKELVPDITERDAYVCGPPPMMAMVEKNLRALGVPRRHIHRERFAL